MAVELKVHVSSERVTLRVLFLSVALLLYMNSNNSASICALPYMEGVLELKKLLWYAENYTSMCTADVTAHSVN